MTSLVLLRDQRIAIPRSEMRTLGRLADQGDGYACAAMERRWPGSRNATADAVARVFRVNRATAWRWLNGEARIPGRVVFALVLADIADGVDPRG